MLSFVETPWTASLPNSTADKERPALVFRRSRLIVLTGLATFVLLQLTLAIVLENGPDRDPLYSVRLKRMRGQLPGSSEKALTVVMLGLHAPSVGCVPRSYTIS